MKLSEIFTSTPNLNPSTPTMEKKYFKAIDPIVDPPQENEFVMTSSGKLKWEWCQGHAPNMRWLNIHGGVEDTPDYWLKPVEVPAVGGGEFAEWASGNGWTFDRSTDTWKRFELYNDNRRLTTPDLLTMYLNEKQKG